MNERMSAVIRQLNAWRDEAELHLRQTADATHEQVTPLVDRAQGSAWDAAKTAAKRISRGVRFPPSS